jgi:prophage antirepressor-like protein
LEVEKPHFFRPIVRNLLNFAFNKEQKSFIVKNDGEINRIVSGECRMNELINVFQYQENELRTVLKNGEPWFAAVDVCEVLEIVNPSHAIKRLEEDERASFKLGHNELNFVNEPGLYSLILGSRKPEAKQFKRWITHEVLPSIRKTGQYVKPLSEKEQLMAAMKLSIESAEEITAVKEEVKEVRVMVENQITLDHGEQRRIQRAIGHKVYELESDQVVRTQLFREIHREIKDRFAVASYKDIKRKDLQSAIRYIEAWIPRRVS